MVGPEKAVLACKMNLLEAFFQQCRALLADADLDANGGQEAAGTARALLIARGFDAGRIASLPLGIYTSRHEVWHGLAAQGFSVDAVRISKVLSDVRLPGRIIGPIAESSGRLIGFWARRPGAKDLFLHRNWTKAVPLLWLDVALAGGAGISDLLIVEDALDALLFHEAGFPNVAATGGRFDLLTPDRWRQLAALGVRSATLVAESRGDQTGELRAAIESAYRAEAAPDLFVLPPNSYGGLPGPAAFLRRLGAAEFRALLACRVEAVWFMAAKEKAAASSAPPCAPPARPAKKAGYCELHGCPITECFCFD